MIDALLILIAFAAFCWAVIRYIERQLNDEQ
jgi:hypothetical protein